MSHHSVIDQALEKARAKVASADTGVSTDKTASAGLAGEAREVAQALEYLSVKIADDGTVEGSHRVRQIQDFLKRAGKGGPAESVAPTGTQAMPPQAGKRTITPSPGGSRPQQSEAPTGKQTTIGQDPPALQTPPTESASSKKASGPSTLYDLVDRFGTQLEETDKEAAKGGPADSEALHDQAAPPRKNENTNIDMLRSNQGPVSATKAQAKRPTRARLKALFSSASDVGPSQEAARAAFPNALRRAGGIKEAAKKGKGLYNPDGSARYSDADNAAGVGGALGGAVALPGSSALGAAIGSKSGHRGRAALYGEGGGLGGAIAGGLAGNMLGGGNAGARQLGGRMGAALGAGLGARRGHWRSRVNKAKDEAFRKSAEDTSWGERQLMANKALSSGPGVGRLVVNKDVLKGRMRSAAKPMAGGAAGGALLGGAVGALKGGRSGALKGALIGGGVGALGGEAYGVTKHDKKYLAKKGLRLTKGGFDVEVMKKKASLAEYHELYKLAAAGELGEEAQAFTTFIDEIQV